jgi:hypothetical protein
LGDVRVIYKDSAVGSSARLLGLLVVCLVLAIGCKDASMQQLEGKVNKQKKQMEDYKNRKILVPTKPPKPPNPNLKRRAPTSSSSENLPRLSDSVPVRNQVNSDLERSFQASRATALVTGKPEEVAVRTITKAVQASLEVDPTLVVWVIDRTPSASKLVTDGLAAAKAMYDVPEIRQASISLEQNLSTAVVMYDSEVEFVLDSPGDWQETKAAFDKIKIVDGGKEMTFTALKQAFDKYLPLRTKDRRQVMFVVITDEAGDDRDQADAVADLAKKNTIPVYVIGSPAPWGQTNPFLALGEKSKGEHDDTYPSHGPESLQSERVEVQMWATNFNTSREDFTMIDSGFGPYHLERLCRVSDGKFFITRPAAGSVYQYRSTTIGHKFWPNGTEMRFDPKVAEKYAPHYVARKDYDSLLAANKTWQALVDAAKLPPINITGFPEQTFEKRNEAQFTRQLNTAQQFAARHSPPVDQVYNVLSAGEGDRDKQTSPRLQAEFDLAMGRTLAAKVRLDGYNAMLAALKRGKNFANEGSRRWHIEQSINIETGSQLQKMSEKAIMYLQRVQKDHPGTPWAKLAEQELKVHLGWEWRES